MTTVFVVILWAVAAVFALCLVIVAMPVRFDLRLAADTGLRYGVFVRPFFGTGPEIALVDSSRAAKPAKKRKAVAKRKKTSRWRPSARALLAAGPELLRGLLRAVRFERVRLDAVFGLDDPADTGQLYGMLCPLIYTSIPSQHATIDLRPVFDRPVLKGALEAQFRVAPLRIAGALIRFGWRIFRPVR